MPDAEVIERSDLILDELARLGLVLARNLQQRALETEDNDQAVRLAQAFHHLSRSVRQSLALTEKLQRDRKRDLRHEQDHGERRTSSHRDARKAHVRAAVRRLVWTEAERSEVEKLRLATTLDLILDAEAPTEAFLQGPVQRQIEKLCKRLGLKPPTEDTDALRRSSA